MCSYSWRVPLTAGHGPLEIVASHDLGELGQVESEPVVLRWRWYYHFPLAILWIPLALLLIGVKENRKWQAWLILMAIFAAMVFWGMLVRLFMMPSFASDPITFLFGAVAMSWAAVWLLGPWLAPHGWFGRLLLALGTMLVMGVLAHCANYGIALPSSSQSFAIGFGAASLALPLAVALSGLCCRRHGRPRIFMGWLFLWTSLGGIVGMLVSSVAATIVMLPWEGPFQAMGMLVLMIAGSLLGGAFFGIGIYLTNLPFMVLAFRNPLYRERFYRVLSLPAPAIPGASPFRDGEPWAPQPASEQQPPGGRGEEAVPDPGAPDRVEEHGASPIS